VVQSYWRGLLQREDYAKVKKSMKKKGGKSKAKKK
jgi:hypothetical protein